MALRVTNASVNVTADELCCFNQVCLCFCCVFLCVCLDVCIFACVCMCMCVYLLYSKHRLKQRAIQYNTLQCIAHHTPTHTQGMDAVLNGSCTLSNLVGLNITLPCPGALQTSGCTSSSIATGVCNVCVLCTVCVCFWRMFACGFWRMGACFVVANMHVACIQQTMYQKSKSSLPHPIYTPTPPSLLYTPPLIHTHHLLYTHPTSYTPHLTCTLPHITSTSQCLFRRQQQPGSHTGPHPWLGLGSTAHCWACWAAAVQASYKDTWWQQ